MFNEKFKFRVYLEETAEMLYSDDWVNIDWKQMREWNENGILMQVTGLKDINKNDIYEGDIIEVYNTYKEETFKGSVDFKNGSFYIKKDDLTSHDRWINYEMKVMGNIFEDPKLLLK